VESKEVRDFGGNKKNCSGLNYCLFFHSTHIDMSLSGVEIMVNSSGSYMQLRKAYITTDLIRNATFKAGGAYLFNNLRGCDGQRVYFNGCSAIALNGDIVARGKQYSLQDVVCLSKNKTSSLSNNHTFYHNFRK
jgi:hypothetical protein